MSARVFRYVVKSEGATAVASFDDKFLAEQYCEFLKSNGHWAELLVVDQYELMQRDAATRRKVARVLDAIRVLKVES